MSEQSKIRISETDGIVDVKILMKHDMESGQRKGADGKNIPAWFINTVVVKAQGKDVFSANFGTAVSKDPFINFKYKGSKSDKISVTWTDNRGNKRTDELPNA
jgi:sulfur-oxidizing protein SoxZ